MEHRGRERIERGGRRGRNVCGGFWALRLILDCFGVGGDKKKRSGYGVMERFWGF